MKKIAVLLFVVLALFLNIHSFVYAAGSMLSATATQTQLKTGDFTTITVKLTTEENVRSIGVKVAFDADVLTLVEAKSLVTDAMVNKYDTAKNNLAAMLSSARIYDGDVLSLTFEAKDTSEKTTVVRLTPSLKNGTTTVNCVDASINLTIANETKEAAILDTASLSLLDAIGVNFYTILPDAVKNDAGAYALFDGPNGKQKIFVKDAVTGTDGRTVFTYAVYAKETRDEINLRLFDGTDAQIDMVCNDTPISAEGYFYSVDTYLAAIAAGSEGAEMKALAAALADYGAAADRLFGYNGANAPAVAADLSAITAESLAAYKLTQNGTAPDGFSLTGATLMLESETTLRVYFKAQTAPAVTVDGAAVTPVQKGNAYYVAIPNILAKELGVPHTIAFGEYGISCSALTYAYSVLRAYPESNTSDEAVNLRTLARALVRYQQTAVAYFESK